MTQLDLSPSDAELFAEFLKFLQEHPEMLQGTDAPIPILFYILAACFAVFLYDYLITLDEEVNYVWSSPWFIGLPLFYANRYVPFIDVGMFIHFSFFHMTPEGSYPFHLSLAKVRPSPFHPTHSDSYARHPDSDYHLRTCALWHNDFFIVLFMILLLISTLMVTCFFTARYMSSMLFAPTPSFINGCLIAEDSESSLFIYIALFITELVIVSLTIVKAVEHLRQNQNRSSWIGQLYKNGILYCICILVLSLVNIILPATNLPYPYKQSFRMPQHVFHSMFCNRVFLQLLKHRHHFDRRARRGRRNSQASTVDYDGTWYSTAPDLDSAIAGAHSDAGTNIFTTVMLEEDEVDADADIMTTTDLDLEASKSVQDDKTVIEMDIIKNKASGSQLGCGGKMDRTPEEDDWIR